MPISLEFQPAALEIVHTAVPRGVRALSWILLLACMAAGAWAWLGRVDVVAVAQGKVIPAGRVKLVQSPEAGVVKAILVGDGDRVEAGTALVELDSTAPDAEAAQAEDQVLALALEQARLRGLLDATAGAGLSLATVPGASAEQLQVLRLRVETEFGAQTARVHALVEDLRQRSAERAAAGVRLRQLEATIPLVAERASSRATLVAAGLFPRTQWLEVEEMRLAQLARRDVERETVAMLDAALAGLEQRRRETDAGYRQGLLAELAQVEPRLAALRQEAIKARQRRARHVLAAPVTGTVQRLAVRTVGGVVTPAQVLMEIVPDGGGVEVEAWVRNQDAGQVRASVQRSRSTRSRSCVTACWQAGCWPSPPMPSSTRTAACSTRPASVSRRRRSAWREGKCHWCPAWPPRWR